MELNSCDDIKKEAFSLEWLDTFKPRLLSDSVIFNGHIGLGYLDLKSGNVLLNDSIFRLIEEVAERDYNANATGTVGLLCSKDGYEVYGAEVVDIGDDFE